MGVLKTRVMTVGTAEERAILARAAVLDIDAVVGQLLASNYAGDILRDFPQFMPAFEDFWCEFVLSAVNSADRRHERAVLGSCHRDGDAFQMEFRCYWNTKRFRIGVVAITVPEGGGG